MEHEIIIIPDEIEDETIKNMIIFDWIEEENAIKYIGIIDDKGKEAYNNYNKLYDKLISIYDTSRFIASWNYNNSKPLTRISNEDILAGWIRDPIFIDTY